ncbi:L,D-transpeptidase family protein [Rhodobacteraceae bacterium M382]|nr:L,D-transpeptidase family protein [Rhodobacteraceae bacterium M382]
MTPLDLVLSPRGIRYAGRYFPCSIGRNGLTADKREGDGATPVGVLRITALYYRPDRIAKPAAWARPISPRDLWSDDVTCPNYNHHVHGPHALSHESLRRSDPLYDLILTTDWNWPKAIPGKGSAIFIHQWRRPGFPTEGCIAFSRSDLHWIAPRIPPGTRVFIPMLQ